MTLCVKRLGERRMPLGSQAARSCGLQLAEQNCSSRSIRQRALITTGTGFFQFDMTLLYFMIREATSAMPPAHSPSDPSSNPRTSPGAPVPFGIADCPSTSALLVLSLRNAASRVTVCFVIFLIPCAPSSRRSVRYLDYCAIIPRQMQRKQAQSPREVLLMKTRPSAFPITTPLIPTRGPAHGTRAQPSGPPPRWTRRGEP